MDPEHVGAKGVCTLSGCQADWGDCDKILETGCEADLLNEDENCGVCDKECILPEHCYEGDCSFQCPPALTNCGGEGLDTSDDPLNCGICEKKCMASGPTKLGICAASKCGEVSCDVNKYNINLTPDDGCEYECALTNNGEETCDTFDNDCDKQIDEGFDLATDVSNCGACGNKCGPYPHVTKAKCAASKCAIETCEEGYKDSDLLALTGCEEMIATGQVWVDAWNFFDPDEDGSKAHPFDTIQDALKVATEGMQINIQEGTYAGGLVITVPKLVLKGQGRTMVFMLGPQFGTGTSVKAADVEIRDLTVQGAAIGIEFNGVNSGKVASVDFAATAGGTNQEAAAIKVLNGGGVGIDDVLIDGVTGGTGAAGCSAWPGREGSGILIDNSKSVKVTNSIIRAITGGTGGYAQCACYSPGGSGTGAGVLLRSNSLNNEISLSRIYNVAGGKGGSNTCGQVADGSIGAGVMQSGGGGLVVDKTVIYDIRGGLTGNNQVSAYSACVYGYSVGAVLITNLTCVGSGKDRQRGIWADLSTQGLYGVSSTIIARLSEHCLFSHSGNFPSTLMASYSDAFDCKAGATSNAQLAANSITIDPLFVDEAKKDYHLKSTSPCIDTGKPTDEYCNEPSPNGCRIDMGAYGDTSAATPNPAAQSCPCN